MREKQDFEMYNDHGVYDHKGRWISYYYQYAQARELESKKILEVGIGNGTMSTYLKKVGFTVTTADYEEHLGADVTADVTALPFKDNEFDLSMCCEVLEHLPFSEFTKAVKELARVSSKYVFITVPDHRRVPFSLSIKIPFMKQRTVSIRIPTFKQHVFDGFHYWEIGHKGFPVKRIINEIESVGLEIIKHESPTDCPMIHYFLLRKKTT
jgi:ubiquinone/menaquinone biosynthesis C-methylase UbiE